MIFLEIKEEKKIAKQCTVGNTFKPQGDNFTTIDKREVSDHVLV